MSLTSRLKEFTRTSRSRTSGTQRSFESLGSTASDEVSWKIWGMRCCRTESD